MTLCLALCWKPLSFLSFQMCQIAAHNRPCKDGELPLLSESVLSSCCFHYQFSNNTISDTPNFSLQSCHTYDDNDHSKKRRGIVSEAMLESRHWSESMIFSSFKKALTGNFLLVVLKIHVDILGLLLGNHIRPWSHAELNSNCPVLVGDQVHVSADCAWMSGTWAWMILCHTWLSSGSLRFHDIKPVTCVYWITRNLI